MAAAYYYIDYTNGSDSRSGLRIPAGDYNSTDYNTVDSVPDTTHFVDSALTGADNYISGSYVWNVTKGQGRLITAFDSGSDRVEFGVAMSPTWEAGDTYYILDSWKTLPQYTSVSVRTAGDIAYVRANQTHTYNSADITYDEDGTTTTPISLLGCTSTIDPWHDASSVRPIIDFGAAAYQSLLSGDDYWTFKNLKFQNSTDTSGAFYADSSRLLNVDNCSFLCGAGQGFVLSQMSNIQVTNSVFSGTYAWKARLSSCSGTFTGCSFDCLVDNDSTYCAYGYAVTLLFDTCTFGTSKKPSTGIFTFFPNARIVCRNCTFVETGSAWAGIGGGFTSGTDSCIHIMDKNTTIGSSETHMFGGSVYNSTTVRTGGATSSAKMLPSTSCALLYPMTVTGEPLYDFLVYCPASPTTITMYIRSEGVWGGSYPTNAELYMETTYHNSASVGTMATVTSTQVLADGTTWVAFTNTFTPTIAGYAYVKIYLKKYVAACGCYVDIKPVIS